MRYSGKQHTRRPIALAGLLALASAAAAQVSAGTLEPAGKTATPAGAGAGARAGLAGTPSGDVRPPADLAALLHEAQANSPAILAAAARLEAAGRIPSQARTSPDPEASIGYTNDGLSGFTLGDSEFSTLKLTWTQEVPYPGKLGRAAEVAAAGVDRSGKDLERARLEIAAAVKSAFADLYRIDRTAAILAETHSVLDSLAQAARRRYEVGEGTQESILKAQTEILRLEAELARVTQDRRSTELRLNAAVGRGADTPIGVATDLPQATLPDDRAALTEEAVASSPELGGLAAAVRQREAGLQLARLNLKPDFIWSTSYDYRGGLDPMVTGAFGLRLPIHRERKQAQAAAQAESDVAAARLDLAERQVRVRTEVRDLIAHFERAETLITLYGQGVIPQARGTYESARSSYSVGRLGFLDLFSDLVALLNAQIDFAAQEADRVKALAALEPLVGRELIRVEPGTEEERGVPGGGGGRE